MVRLYGLPSTATYYVYLYLFVVLINLDIVRCRTTCGYRTGLTDNSNYGQCNVTEFWIDDFSQVNSTLAPYATSKNALIIFSQNIYGKTYLEQLGTFGDSEAILLDEKSARISSLSMELVAGAIPQAILKYCNSVHKIDLTFVIVYLNDQCMPTVGVPNAMEMVASGIDVVFGATCGEVTVHTGVYVGHWNVPLLSISSELQELKDKNLYKTLIRVGERSKYAGDAFFEVLKFYEWSNIAMIQQADDLLCESSFQSLRETIDGDGKAETNVVGTYEIADTDADEKFIEYLKRIKEKARIVLLCIDNTLLQRLMKLVQEESMTSSEYVYLYTNIFTTHPALISSPWGSTSGMDEAAIKKLKAPYARIKIISQPVSRDQDQVDLMEIIANRMTGHPFYLTHQDKLGITMSPKALDLYDAVQLYLTTLDEAINNTIDYRNGTYIFSKLKGKSYNGVSGEITVDDSADRISDFWLWYLGQDMKEFKRYAVVEPLNDERITVEEKPFWGTADGNAPLNEPACGYRGEICFARVRTNIVIGVFSALAVLAVLLLLALLIYRKRKFERDLKQRSWQIHCKDIHNSSELGRTKSGQSLLSNAESQANLSRRMIVDAAQMFTKVANYNDQLCAIKKIKKKNCKLKRNELVELKKMKDLSHENVNLFIGACIEEPFIFILTTYCTKGCLQDILENEEIKLDWTFKYSLIADIVNGLTYIHDSPVQVHGDFRSSCCLIDNRWTLKIANAGLRYVKFTNIDIEEQEEYKFYRDKQWTAPELLRMENIEHPSLAATRKSDIYSLAIVLQEILFRARPYFNDDKTPEEIVKSVKEGMYPPFRPSIPPTTTDTDLKMMIKLMQDCWHEHPDVRPEIHKLKKWLNQVFRGRKLNLLDVMVQKLEKYTNNLEEIVEKRVDEIMAEKEKTDMLLYSLLPASVADNLKDGKTVDAEVYDNVTIYFSDIVGFTEISVSSTPIQVVNLLNDLYLMFDSVLQKHDVYKVETVGDSYMVVSGCPDRNGDTHASAIANMSVCLRIEATGFKIRHMADRPLLLRIGLHSGPCAAGVIGVAMPRYCLFGITVSVASAVESAGEAMKIHVSDACHYFLSKTSNLYKFTSRGEIDIKGHGMCKTYWLDVDQSDLKTLLADPTTD